MSLPSIQLDAFVAAAKEQSFSLGAKRLHITQSALSQRIKQLETVLATTLIIRDPAGLKLTPTGEELLRYCQQRDHLEAEFLAGPLIGESNISGPVRIAGYSSIMNSVIIPALAPLIKKHPSLVCDFKIAEMDALPALLRRGQADFILLDYPLSQANIEKVILGEEKYVAIESTKANARQGIYLDHDMSDMATSNFFNRQKNQPQYRREYFGDVHSILAAVILGYGSAVMSEHLLAKTMPIKILSQYQPVSYQVVLHHHRQPYYPKSFAAIINSLHKNKLNLAEKTGKPPAN